MQLAESVDRAVEEIRAAVRQVDDATFERLAADLVGAGRIVCFAMGREGLALRAFVMRLMHLGLDAHMWGDITAPPVGPGDVVLVIDGPGELEMTSALVGLAHRNGARVWMITAQPDARDPGLADAVLAIPAQTMADDRGGASLLPMGTAFEIGAGLLLDLMVLRLLELTGQTLDEIRVRHANLE